MYQSLAIKPFDLLCLHQHNPERYPFLLQSSAGYNQLGAFSLLFAFPKQALVLRDIDEFDFFEQLTDIVDIQPFQTELPFVGGWFVFLSYDLSAQIEPKLRASMVNHTTDEPLAYAVHIPAAVIIDHQKESCYVVDECADSRHIDQMLADIDQIKPLEQSRIAGQLIAEDEAIFLNNVRKCQDYIVNGDIFQANLSRMWRFDLDDNIPSGDIYARLRARNPTNFSALACFQDFDIISSSPERLFSVNNGIIETRPIAGTAQKGKQNEQAKHIDRLLRSPKERAEHIMLVDLERNDLGRVCRYGSVRVDELMQVETLTFVHHLVSNIQGQLKDGVGVADIIKALFPGGSITGCPKVRCMEIIAELEGCSRGAYTGSVGYISRHGKMDFNILIRSITNHSHALSFRTGAGIVFDSVAEYELQETHHKAAGLLAIFDNKF